MSNSLQQKQPKYNYFDFKAGKCTDLQYMQSAYGGNVEKHYSKYDSKKQHPFFVIIRKTDEHYEAKVYDLTRGLLDKRSYRRPVKHSDYWVAFTSELSYSDYIQFLIDTHEIFPPKPKKIKDIAI